MEPATLNIIMYSVLILIILVILYVFIKNFKDIKETLQDLKNHFSRLKVKTKEQEVLATKTDFEKQVIDTKVIKAEQFIAKIDETVEKKLEELDKKIEDAQIPSTPKKEDVPPDIVILKPETYFEEEKPKVVVTPKPVVEEASPLWLTIPVIIIGTLGWIYYQIRNKN